MKDFIEFNMDYYRKKVDFYKKNELSEAEVYEARQLLKMVQDVLTKFSDYRDGRFYIKVNSTPEVFDKAMEEIRSMLLQERL